MQTSYDEFIPLISQLNHNDKLRLAQWLINSIATEEGLLLKPKTALPTTNIDDIAGCLAYQGNAKTIEEMNEGIKQAIIEKWGQNDSY